MTNQNIINDRDEHKKPQTIRFSKSDYSEDIWNVLEWKINIVNGELELDDFTTLTTESKDAIKNFQWTDIHLDWLKNLNQEDAKLLAWVECKYLWLNGLEYIDKNTADELWKSKCEYLLLWWLPSLNKDVSKALSNYKWDILFLDWVETLDKDTAEEILNFKCRCIYLIWLKNISPEIKENLKNFKWTIRL